MKRHLAAALVALSLASAHLAPAAAQTQPPVIFHTTHVDGLDIFSREAGPADAPVLLLLHGIECGLGDFAVKLLHSHSPLVLPFAIG